MTNPDIQLHELAAMRVAANKMPFDVQKKFNVLLDAYEDLDTFIAKQDDADALCEKLQEAAESATKMLREAVPDNTPKQLEKRKAQEYGEFVSEDSWQERLAEFDPPEDPGDGTPWVPPSADTLAKLKLKRDALILAELGRARTAEEKLRKRVETLEDAVEAAIEELK